MTITDEEEEATHIVYDEQDPLEDEFARAAMRRDRQTLFHFYYMPDSYDSWAAGVELDYDPPESPFFFDGQWKVSVKEGQRGKVSDRMEVKRNMNH